MGKRYLFEEADINISIETIIDTFTCPECNFEYNAKHICDDPVGGYECPNCEVVELARKLKEMQQENDRLKYWETDANREITYYRNKAISLEKENEDLQQYNKAIDSLRLAGVRTEIKR